MPLSDRKLCCKTSKKGTHHHHHHHIPQNQSDNKALCSFLFIRFKYNDRVYLRKKQIQTLFLYGGEEQEEKELPSSTPHRGGPETLVKVLAAVLLPQRKKTRPTQMPRNVTEHSDHIRERDKNTFSKFTWLVLI